MTTEGTGSRSARNEAGAQGGDAGGLLTDLEAAYHLGITRELVFAYTRVT